MLPPNFNITRNLRAFVWDALAIREEINASGNTNTQFCIFIFFNNKITECCSHSNLYSFDSTSINILKWILLLMCQSDTKMPHLVWISDFHVAWNFSLWRRNTLKTPSWLHLCNFFLCCCRGLGHVTSKVKVKRFQGVLASLFSSVFHQGFDGPR